MTDTNRTVKDLEWDLIVREYKTSGLSVKRWCQNKGFRPSQLYWQIRKRQNKDLKAQEVQWISLRSETPAEKSTIKVKIGSAEIIVSNGFSSSLFTEVVKSLTALC